jgi:hypothetical protein
MKIMYLKVMAMLACFSLNATNGLPSAHAEKNRKPLQGEDKVKWEDKWYPLDDGQGQKLMARRGIGQGTLWVQVRNDYNQKVECGAVITCILHGGEKSRHQWALQTEPGETQTHPYLPGEEICKVEVKDLKFEAESAEAELQLVK